MIIAELEECIRFTQTQCSLAHRRVILGENIPHDDKVFSYFEPHTELINRGKSPYPIEFGHRVLVIQDRAGFILKYLIMDHATNDKVLAPAMKDLQEQYGGKIISASLSVFLTNISELFCKLKKYSTNLLIYSLLYLI